MNVYQKLGRILLNLNLNENQSKMVVTSHVCPGLTPFQLGKQCGFKRMMTYRTLDELIEKGFLKIEEDQKTKKRIVLPRSLEGIAHQIENKGEHLMRFATQLKDIDSVIQSPCRELNRTNIERLYNDEAIEEYYDTHYRDWNNLYGFGDFETLAESIGVHGFMWPWMEKRVKKGRKSDAVVTTNGKYTRYMKNKDERQLRNTIRSNYDMKGKWVEFFPEIGLSYMFCADGKNWNILKIESEEVTDSYFQIVKRSLR